jgi:long-chain fatty acid transport protein
MTTKLDWKDSWIVSLGSEYQLTEKWTLRGAIMYNQTPVRASTSDVDLPTGDTYAMALGTGYKFSESVSADAAAIVAYGTERTLDHSSAPAGSEFSAISFYVSLGVTYRF